ncbi:hypothetical protein [Haloprofundus salilacus]|uniref:hypothetical protein n=1 Tax=Haloprofundus salilacus TaxID=2876190 RepID=UPI001CCAA6AA|nr:hypothetical protein [Haloprofundus salilacus]
MADFTIFEVHLHDGFSFSPTNTAPMLGGEKGQQSEAVEEAKGRVSKLLGKGAASDDGTADTEGDVDQIETAADEVEDDESDSGGSGGKLLLALVLVVVITAAARSLMGDDAGFDELEELDELSEEA